MSFFDPLTNADFSSEGMTLEYCGQLCSGPGTFIYMGVSGTQCHCFANLLLAKQLSNGACNLKCPGDEAEICGGKGVLSVYTLENDVFKKSWPDCPSAYMQNLISPKNDGPSQILDPNGTPRECLFENVVEQSKPCPKGWIGKADENQCY